MSPQHSLVLYLVVPLWLVAGFADWLCHRSSHIEATSGAKESALHLLMLAEVGLPLLAALYLEVNALILGIFFLGLLAHEATVYIDVRYASSRRHISTLEQLIHSVLDMSPLLVLLLLASANWGQWLALFAMGTEPARFELAGSALAPGGTYTVWLVVAILALALIPYVEEWMRGRRVSASG